MEVVFIKLFFLCLRDENNQNPGASLSRNSWVLSYTLFTGSLTSPEGLLTQGLRLWAIKKQTNLRNAEHPRKKVCN